MKCTSFYHNCYGKNSKNIFLLIFVEFARAFFFIHLSKFKVQSFNAIPKPMWIYQMDWEVWGVLKQVKNIMVWITFECFLKFKLRIIRWLQSPYSKQIAYTQHIYNWVHSNEFTVYNVLTHEWEHSQFLRLFSFMH